MATRYLAALQPNDGDALDAESVNVALRKLADLVTLPVASMALTLTRGGASKRFYDVCYGPGAGPSTYGMFLAVGMDGADARLYATSANGAASTWNEVSAATDVYLGCAHGGAGAYGSRHFVIVGRTVTSVAQIWSAPESNGSSMSLVITERTAPGGLPADSALNSVAWNGTVWCAVGNTGTILTATAHDGVWTLRTPASSYAGDFIKVLALSTGRLVAVGYSEGALGGGVVQYSDDNGVTWTTAAERTSDLWNAVDCGNGVLLACTSSGNNVLRSANNGSTWSLVSTVPDGAIGPETFVTDYQEAVFHFAGVVYAVLKKTGIEQRMIACSYDYGLTWPQYVRGVGSGVVWEAVAACRNRIVAVGGDAGFTDYATIMTSGVSFGSVS